MKKVILSLFIVLCSSLSFGQVYLNNFPGATASDAPSTLDAHLTAGAWTTTGSAFVSYAGCSGQALSLANSSFTSTTWTLPLTVASGYKLTLTSFSFCTAHSGTGYTNWSLIVAGTTVGSGTNASSSTNTGTINITGAALTAVSMLTGTVNVQIVWSGGSLGSGGTTRLDDFDLNGSVTANSCSGTPAAGTASAVPANLCTTGTSVITLTGGAAPVSGISYQWQSSPDSSTWTNVTGGSGATTTAYTTPSITTTTYYRCKTVCSLSAATVYSNGAKVTVTSIASGPSNATIGVGTGTAFTTTVAGTTGATYQWQRSTTGSGGTYANITGSTMDITGTYSGFTTATLTLTNAPADWNGYAYRCIVTNTCGSITSSGATLTVTSPPCTGTPATGIATASPASACGSGVSTLSLAAYTAGAGITYQWQSSADSAVWSNISGATNLTYTTPTNTVSTYYRCITSCLSSATYDSSNGARFVINPLPFAGGITGGLSICPPGAGVSTTTLSDTASGGTWTSVTTSHATVSPATGTSTTVTGVAAGTSVISYTVTNGCGTAVATQTVTVNPNPGAGTISGSTMITLGVPVTFTNPTAVGTATWSASNTVASVTAGGVVTGTSLGVDTISYSVTNSCGAASTFIATTVTPVPPVVTSVSPNAAIPGTPLTITGTNFNTNPANDIVYFGATRATVTAASATALTVTLPADASFAGVSVLDSTIHEAGYQQSSFLPTYSNSAYIPGIIDFDARVDLTAGTTPTGVAIGDLDGDGKADIAVSNAGAASVSVYRNISATGVISASSFTLAATLTSGTTPNNLAIGDIDGDGRPEIVTSNYGAASVSVFLNTSAAPGTISFAAKQDFTTGTQPYNVVIADLDGDGRADLATPNFGSATISVLRNVAVTGTINATSFAPQVTFATAASPHFLAAADFNGDGRKDLAAVSSTGSNLSVFLNTGSAGIINSSSFALPGVVFTTGTGPVCMAVADFDGDGKQDIATVGAGNTVYLLKNAVAPGATSIVTGAFVNASSFSATSTPTGIAVGDIDGDGKADIITSSSAAAVASVFRNISTGTGSFLFNAKVDMATGTGPVNVAVGDLDADGKPDIVTANSTGATWSVLRNDPSGFPPVITSVTPGSAIPGAPVTITGSNFSTTPANDFVYFGATKAAVTAASSTSLTVTVPADATYAGITVEDTSTHLTGYQLFPFLPGFDTSIYLRGVLGFNAPVNFTAGSQAYNLAIGDLDGDGKSDFVVTNTASNTMTVYRNTSTSGSITAASFASSTITLASGPIGVAIGDLDGDGKPDVAVTYSTGTLVAALRNTSSLGAISFAAPVTYATVGATPSYVLINDVDGDGKSDLVVANEGSTSGTSGMVILRNTSLRGAAFTSASFGAAVSFTTGTYPYFLAMGDLDGDGKRDILCSSYGNGAGTTVSLFRNISSPGVISTASLSTPATITAGTGTIGVAIGDLNGDGKPDIATGNYGASTISVFRNIAVSGTLNASSFDLKTDYTAGSGSRTIAISDLDGDGKPDLVVGDQGGNAVSVFRNTYTSGAFNSTSFSTHMDLALTPTNATTAVGLAVGDLDGDGLPDIVTTNYGNALVSVIRNNIPFKPATITAVTPNAAAPGTTVTITGTRFSTTPANNIVYFGAVRATVSAATATSLTVTVPAGAIFAPVTVTSAVTGLVAYEDSCFTPVYNNSGFRNDTFSFKNYVAYTSTAAPETPYSGAIGDVNGDGKPDLIVNNSAVGIASPLPSISVFLNNSATGTISAGSFALAPVATYTLTSSGRPNNVKLADIDGDGKLDIVATLNNVTTTSVVVLRNTTTVAANPSFVAANITVGAVSLVAAIVDLDGDGKPDIAASLPAGAIGILRNTSTAGSVSFAALTSVTTSGGTTGICFADLDGDGLPDLAAANAGLSGSTINYSGTTATIARNTSVPGAISFATPASLTTGTGPVDIIAADMDGDSKPDLLVTNLTSGTFSVFHNSATPGTLTTASFGTAVNFATGTAPTGIAVADLNGDGRPDVVVSNNLSNTLSLYRNLGTAGPVTASSFGAPLTVTTGAAPATVTIGDLDNDGYPDIVTGNSGSNSVAVIRNYPKPVIAPVTGVDSVCPGATVTLSNAAAGGSWSSVHPAIATVDPASGVVTGIAPGTDSIIYTTYFGGDTASVSFVMTVDSLSPAGVITGFTVTTVGGSVALTDSIAGGVWTSSNPAVATINDTGLVLGVATGMDTITYTTTNGCGSVAVTSVVTVTNSAFATVSGTTAICLGDSAVVSFFGTPSATITYNVNGGAGIMATLDAGGNYVVTVSPGATSAFNLTHVTMGAYDAAITGQTAIVGVNPLPFAGSITGATTVCAGLPATLAETASGGSWSTLTPAVDTISSAGVVTGISAGSDTIRYTVTNGCGTAVAVYPFTVNPQPFAGGITGPSTVCQSASIALADTAAGGTWSSSTLSVASISSFGGVTGVAGGTDTIRYTVTNSCGTAVASAIITVNPLPVAGTITGLAVVCPSATIALANASGTTGGTWSSVTPAVATVSASGVVTGVSAGADTIKYTITNGCGTVVAFKAITVNPAPAAGTISGATSICGSSAISLSGTGTGGTWSSTNTAVAAVNASGVVTGVSAGATTISYTVTNSCGTVAATHADTVYNQPAAVTLSPATVSLCPTSPAVLITASGAAVSYTASATTGAISIDESAAYAVVTSSLNITGIPAGATITGVSAVVSVNGSYSSDYIYNLRAPNGNILNLINSRGAGTSSYVADFTNTTISSAGVNSLASGGAPFIGTWAPDAVNGVGASPYIANVTSFSSLYSTPNGSWTLIGYNSNHYSNNDQIVLYTIIVNYTYPAAITWSPSAGLFTSATDTSAHYTGAATNTIYVRPDTTTTYVATAANGTCSNSTPVTVTVGALAVHGIHGVSTYCVGDTAILADSTLGGRWTTSNTNASIDTATGKVTALAAGTSVITYTYTSGSCSTFTTATIHINALPVIGAIAGAGSLCTGTTLTLTDTTVSGSWTSSAPATATISASGVVTPLAQGAVIITYSHSNGTCSNSDTAVVNVYNAPGAMTIAPAPVSLCANAAPLLVTATGGIAGGTPSFTNTGSYSFGYNSAGVSAVTVTGIPAGAAITNISVRFSSSSSYDGDDIFNIQAPNGNILNLLDALGGASTAGFSNTVISSTAATSVTTAGAPFSGTYAAQAVSGAGGGGYISNATAWSSLTGTLNGTWKLIGVGNYSGSSGTISSFTLTINYTVPASITWSPVTGLYTNAAGTTPYTGAATPVVYAKPLASVIYTATSVNGGCSSSGNDTLTLIPLPVVSPVSGGSAVCTGSSLTLADTASGGTWTSSATSVATVSASGVLTATGTGTTIVSYTKTNTCGAVSASDTVTVNALPAIIPGATPGICQGITGALLSYSGATGNPLTYSILYDATAIAAGFTNVSGATLSGSTITLVVPDTTPANTYTAALSVANGTCASTSYSIALNVIAYPQAALTSAIVPCSGYASDIIFSGTPGAVLAYNIDGGSTINSTITGGTLDIPVAANAITHTYNFTNVHNATCGTLLAIDTTIAIAPMQWTGIADTDWNNTANWSCGSLPTAFSRVVIPQGTPFMPAVLASGSGLSGDLILAPGVTMALKTGAVAHISGKLTNNGSITGNGVASMSGTFAQSVGGTGTIDNFEINNAAGVAIDSGACVTIKNTLSISGGQLATGDSLVLASDSSATARIAAIAPGAGVTGKVQARQWIAGGHRAYRFWGHPFSSAITLGQLGQYLDITGAGGSANGFTTTATNASSAFWYNPLHGNATLGYDPGWTAFSDANGVADSNKFKPFEGIRLFVRGAKGQGLNGYPYTPAAVTIGMAGAVNQGNVTIHMSKGALSDYNQIGNPYPSPVDIGTVVYNAWNRGEIAGSAIYIWDPYVGTVGQFIGQPVNTGAPYSLQPYTSFQVRTMHDNDSLNFSENNKTASANLQVLKTLPDYLSLYVYDVNYHPWDMFRLQFNDAATDGDDDRYDARKPNGPAALNFYSWSADNKKMTIDARPYKEGNVIPLGIRSSYTQDFIIRAEGMAVPSGGKVYLHDKLLKQHIALAQGVEYHFSVTADTNTQGDDRFELALGNRDTIQVSGLTVTMQPNPATEAVSVRFKAGRQDRVEVRLMDISGITLYSKDLGIQQQGIVNLPLAGYAAGIYMVELTSGNNKVVQRLVKE